MVRLEEVFMPTVHQAGMARMGTDAKRRRMHIVMLVHIVLLGPWTERLALILVLSNLDKVMGL